MDASYKKDSNRVYYRVSIPESKFSTFIHYGDSLIPYVDSASDSGEEYEPTEEQKREVETFLKSLLG